MERRALVLMLIAIGITGCAVWRPVSGDKIQSTLTTERPSRVRVTLRDTTLVVKDPRITNDSLVGAGAVSLPLQDLRQIEVRGPNRKANRIVAVCVLVPAAVFLALVSQGREIR